MSIFKRKKKAGKPTIKMSPGLCEIQLKAASRELVITVEGIRSCPLAKGAQLLELHRRLENVAARIDILTSTLVAMRNADKRIGKGLTHDNG